MNTSYVDKFVGYNVVSVVSRSWGSHGQAVDVKHTSNDGKYGNALKSKKKIKSGRKITQYRILPEKQEL